MRVDVDEQILRLDVAMEHVVSVAEFSLSCTAEFYSAQQLEDVDAYMVSLEAVGALFEDKTF